MLWVATFLGGILPFWEGYHLFGWYHLLDSGAEGVNDLWFHTGQFSLHLCVSGSPGLWVSKSPSPHPFFPPQASHGSIQASQGRAQASRGLHSKAWPRPDQHLKRSKPGPERPEPGLKRPGPVLARPGPGLERLRPGLERPKLSHGMLGEGTDGQRLKDPETRRPGDPEKIALCGIISHRPLRGRCTIDFYFKLNQRMGQ